MPSLFKSIGGSNLLIDSSLPKMAIVFKIEENDNHDIVVDYLNNIVNHFIDLAISEIAIEKGIVNFQLVYVGSGNLKPLDIEYRIREYLSIYKKPFKLIENSIKVERIEISNPKSVVDLNQEPPMQSEVQKRSDKDQIKERISDLGNMLGKYLPHYRTIACIAVYNDSSKISKIITEIKGFVDLIIIIDDNSSDDTFERISNTTNVESIRNNIHLGKNTSLKMALLESVKYNPEMVLIIDAQEYQDPSHIPNLTSPITNGEADVVIGSRFEIDLNKTNIPFRRKIERSIINTLNILLTKSKIKDSQSGFRAYNKEALKIILDENRTELSEYYTLLLADSYGLRIVEVPIALENNGFIEKLKKIYERYWNLRESRKLAKMVIGEGKIKNRDINQERIDEKFKILTELLLESDDITLSNALEIKKKIEKTPNYRSIVKMDD